MLESFSSHLFVRQVNMFILNLCLTFHSLSVLFFCFINKSILCKSVLYIHFFLRKFSIFKVSMVLTLCPTCAWWIVICRENASSRSYNLWFVLSMPGRWYGVFEFCFNVLLSWYRKFGRSFILIYLVPLLKVLKLNTPKNNDR